MRAPVVSGPRKRVREARGWAAWGEGKLGRDPGPRRGGEEGGLLGHGH